MVKKKRVMHINKRCKASAYMFLKKSETTKQVSRKRGAIITKYKIKGLRRK
jgi:hypothetical protein